MKFGGIEPLSLKDYPGKVGCIIFTKGCTFECPFCHNPGLVLPEEELKEREKPQLLTEEEVIEFLKGKVGLIDAVTITGGEPTIHEDLPEFLRKVKDMGFDIKLDTNGTNPEMLKKLLEEDLVNYVAMDVKAPLDKYEKFTDSNVNTENIKKSINLIKDKSENHEFRTTVVPELHEEGDFEKISNHIEEDGKWVLQKFRSSGNLISDEFKDNREPTDERMKKIKERYGHKHRKCEIRT